MHILQHKVTNITQNVGYVPFNTYHCVVMLVTRLYGRDDHSIRASVDALCRDGASEISRDPRTKRLQTRRARPSEHTNNNF